MPNGRIALFEVKKEKLLIVLQGLDKVMTMGFDAVSPENVISIAEFETRIDTHQHTTIDVEQHEKYYIIRLGDDIIKKRDDMKKWVVITEDSPLFSQVWQLHQT